MPLVPQVLIDEVLKITDETNEDFLGFPLFFIDDDPDLGPDDERNLQTTADNWANAVGLYLSGLTAPPGAGGIASASVSIAATAMKEALEDGGEPLTPLVDAFGAAIDAALSALSSVAGAFSLTPVPPIDEALPPATSFAGDVTTWVSLGMFTPPGGSPTPWS